MEDDICKKKKGEEKEEAFGLSLCGAEGYEKRQFFLAGKWDVLYLNPATYNYPF